ncbi:MAG: hypothetical protein ABIU63_14985 [Chitinophagaceae bacterium]
MHKLFYYSLLFALLMIGVGCKEQSVPAGNDYNIDSVAAAVNGTGKAARQKFLFDATKAETAGNADWVIDEDNGRPGQVPTPAQTGIVAATPETYWTGALSSWAIALVKQGIMVSTLPPGALITCGDSSNSQDLARYDVFVVDEPNTKFTIAEKIAVLHFVQQGGGLFMIADHTISDRNNDGWDSPAIWNDLMVNNPITRNPFGITINLTNIVELSQNVLNSHTTNPILHGTQGVVTQLDFHNGATLSIDTSANPSVQGLVWRSGIQQRQTGLLCAAAAYGAGRVFVITDSSPMDDGTGAPGNHLFNGWKTYSHTALCMNASLWLAGLQ